MEKQMPHHRLHAVRQLIADGRVKFTKVAVQGAQAMSLLTTDILRVLQDLERTDFYKSMTTFDDHRIWQDVYRPMTVHGPVYLKLSIVGDLLVVSFKEL